MAPDDASFDIADKVSLRMLAQAEDAHFWHRSRNRFIEGRLQRLGVTKPAQVLELGCGGGCVLRALDAAGYAMTGVEGHLDLARLAAERATRAEVIVQDLARGLPSEIAARRFDAVALFDVLEHLDDPRAALIRALSVTRDGGFVVGTVPSMMALWSVVDERAGHRLRYERDGLRELVAGVRGARVVEVVPFNRLLLPPMWLQRRSMQKRPRADVSEANLAVPSPAVNIACYALARTEARLARALDRLPIPGTSLWFAIAKAGAEA